MILPLFALVEAFASHLVNEEEGAPCFPCFSKDFIELPTPTATDSGDVVTHCLLALILTLRFSLK
jgi:hypothetical protein